MQPLTKRWLICAGGVLVAQLLLFAVIHFFMIGAPYWAEIPYAPFQDLFARSLGESWALGLILGVIIGSLAYSGVLGLILAWIFRSRAR